MSENAGCIQESSIHDHLTYGLADVDELRVIVDQFVELFLVYEDGAPNSERDAGDSHDSAQHGLADK